MTDTPAAKTPPSAEYRFGKAVGTILPALAVIIGFAVAQFGTGELDHAWMIAVGISAVGALLSMAYMYLRHGSAAVGSFFDGFGDGGGDSDGDGGGDGGD